MKKDDQKMKREYNDSLREDFMTTRDIAERWNQEVEDENGEKRICVQRRRAAIRNKEWEADDISKLFRRILNDWGLSECVEWYRVHKFYYLKGLNDHLKYVQELVQIEMSADTSKKYTELKEKLEETAAWLDKETKSNNSSDKEIKDNKSLAGAFIFNKNAFDASKEDGKNYVDPFYYIYRLYKKAEKCTMKEITDASYALAELLPGFKSSALQKGFWSLLENSDIHDACLINEYIDREERRAKIEIKLCQHFYEEEDRWVLGDRWLMNEDEAEEICAVKLIIVDYVVKKYIFLMESICKVRAIEKQVMDYSGTKIISAFSFYSIAEEYSKHFEYKMGELESDKEDEEDENDPNNVLKRLLGRFNTKMKNVGPEYIDKEDKEDIIRNFIDEMDALLKEVSLYDKLLKLTDKKKGWSISELDLRHYCELTKKKEPTQQLIKVMPENNRLRIMEEKNLLESIRKMREGVW